MLVQEDCTRRIRSESDVSDDSDIEMLASQSSPKKRALSYVLGVALLAAALYAVACYQSGPFLHKGSVEQTQELAQKVPPSTFYLVKHTFKEGADSEKFWKFMHSANWKEIAADNADAGFYNGYFFPTAAGGPFFCLWEAQAGKTKADVQAHIDTWLTDVVHVSMENHVMELPSKLTGGAPMNIRPFFPTKTAKPLKAETSESTFYLIEHTFQSNSEADINSFWNFMEDADWGTIGADTAAAGFHNGYFFPTARDGPFFCLWEAEAGKTKVNMQKFIDVWVRDVAKVSFNNHVMEIPSKLTGGPPMNIPVFFKGVQAT